MTRDEHPRLPAPARDGEPMPAAELARALDRAAWNASMLARTEALCRAGSFEVEWPDGGITICTSRLNRGCCWRLMPY